MAEPVKGLGGYSQENRRNNQNPQQPPKKKKIDTIPKVARDMFIPQENADQAQVMNYNKNPNLKKMVFKYQNKRKGTLKES